MGAEDRNSTVSTTDPDSLPEDLEREAGGLLANLLSNRIAGVYVFQDDHFLYVNSRLSEMFGYSRNELCQNMGPVDLAAPEHRQLISREIGQCLQNGSSGSQYSFNGIRNGGGLIRVEACCLRAELNGNPAIIGVLIDNTELHESRKRIQQLVDEQRAILENQLVGIAIAITRDRRIIWANSTFENMLGYAKGELIGIPASRLYVNEEDINQAYVFIENDETVHREHEFVRKDGRHIWVNINGTPLKSEIGESLWMFVDVTERMLAEKMLRKQKLFSDDVINSLPGIFYLLDRQGGFVRVNPKFEEVSGYSSDEITSMSALSFFEGKDRETIEHRIREVFEQGDSWAEAEFITKSSRKIPYYFSGHRTLIDDQPYLVGLGIDITERKRAEIALRIAATAFESQESLMITDADTAILRVNQAFTESTGYSVEEAVGQTPRLLKSGRHSADFYRDMWESIRRTGAWQGEIWDRRKNGEVYPKWLSITAVKGEDGIVTNYVGSHIDITERKAAEEKIQHLAYYDHLTGLPNRRLLIDRLQQALASSARGGWQGVLLFIDLDNFKTLNDTLGHDIGDLLLQQVADRLVACVREGDTVARLGGDEFVLMLENMGEHAVEAAAQTESISVKILAVLSQPYQLGSHEFSCTTSIGATLFHNHGQAIEDLFKQAEIAMYQAKKAGRNTMRFFDPQMQEVVNMRADLEKDLRKALEKQQFQLYYQIQVDNQHRAVGAEVLLRWIHPERGMVSPMQFIPLAEETGLILPIGLWVLQTACAQLKEWENVAMARHLTLAVNVSGKQFRQDDFVEKVRHALLESGARPSYLKLELTESVVLENVEDTISKMNEIKALGVGFSLDDFGTGYSSLQYLKRLPLKQIKIDQSFVRDIATDPNDAAIVQTIIAMTQTLGFDVIAEGVETREQHEFLDLRGCHFFQGYLFGRPVSLDMFENLLKSS